MSIQVHCPCGRRLKAPSQLAGRRGVCPQCGRKVLISGPGATAAPDDTAPGEAESFEGPPAADSAQTYRLQRTGSTAPGASSPALPVVGANVFAGEGPRTRPGRKRDRKRQRPAAIGPAANRTRRGGWRESLLFPLRGEAVWVVSTLALLYALFVSGLPIAAFVLRGPLGMAAVLIVSLTSLAYFFHTLLLVLRVAAAGEEDMPLAMDWDVDELLGDLGLALGVLLMGLGPWAGYHGYLAWTSRAAQPWIEWLLIAYALGYLPMATLIAGLFQSVVSANPVSVLWAIVKVPGEYLMTCLFLAVAGALAVGVDLTVGRVPLIGSLLSWWVLFAGAMAAMHRLGTLYHRRRRRFGWFAE